MAGTSAVSSVASSGTAGQLNEILSNVVTAAGFINTRCWNSAPWQQVTHTAGMDTLRPGDVMRFYTVDGAFDFKPKEWNSNPIFEQLEAGQFCAQLCPPRELGIKMDVEMIRGRETEYMSVFETYLDNSLQRLNRQYFAQVVNQLLNGAAKLNQGSNAGIAGGGINLGTVANPLKINVTHTSLPQDIYRQIQDVAIALASVKSQSELGNCIDSWKLMIHQELVLNFAYASGSQYCCDMTQKISMAGVDTYPSMFGNEAIVSTLMPKIPTATGFKTPIILTHSQATAFTGGITSAFVDQEFAMKRWILTETRGGVVMRPQHIFVAWVELVRS